ncbi:MAG: KEOPS complex N(6)-L-threonylcarbamoyladenine synthase Kae1 [Candidatus Diapherotrites archaeon]|nr:KEOPS complex N(6)-L-threonylcarbamoyladenine synthase Kae1 [Candidatus Diapherotrites archaeon]
MHAKSKKTAGKRPGKAKKTVCLGLESTAHTFSAGIADSRGCILANERSAFRTKEGGIRPQEAADFHLQNAVPVISRALEKSGLKIEDISLVAFAQGPGLGPALKVGATAARTLSLIHNLPLVGVNHCIAHIEIGRLLTGAKNPIVVYASGGNTQIIGLTKKHYAVFGETLDIGIGNLLDSFGRKLGLGFPAGPVLDEWYFEGKNYIELPYSVKGTDLVFAGLQTAAEGKIGKVPEKDLAYSLLHTAFAMLCEATERALAHTERKEVLLVGGVASSKALRGMLGKMCEERGAKLFVPEMQYCVDNGAMIAWQGLLEFAHGKRTKIAESAVRQDFRVEETEVKWI